MLSTHSILILEQGTWVTAGLQRLMLTDETSGPPPATTPSPIRGFSRGAEFVEASLATSTAILLIDLATAPEQGLHALAALTRQRQLSRLVLLLDRSQRGLRWELESTGCLLVREKPLSQNELGEICQRLLMRSPIPS